MGEKAILLVEDDAAVAGEIVRHFLELGHAVEHVSDGEEGLQRALANEYAVVILDVQLPSMNGFDICRALRTAKPRVQILMLTTRGGEVDRVLGFELGADDYLVKPFSMSELLARVRSKMRRAGNEKTGDETGNIKIGELELDLERCVVLKGGQPIKLTAKEFELLSFFMQHPGRMYSKYELLELVWQVDSAGYEDAVVSMVRRLRAKIEADSGAPLYILNARGLGYSFAEPSAFEASEGKS